MKQEQSEINKFVQIGLFGGAFWGSIWYFLHIFSFTEVGPNYLLLPFALGNWKEGVWGNVLGVVCVGLLSILVALIYKALFKRFEGILPGILYGLFWWTILFLGLGSIAPVIKNALHLPKETIVTTICIFILYGVFITYSVSFEANNVNQGEGVE
ncbi:YqhR family membrane protein [Bacillus pseudomycoides]|uniref:YqhR family membrane protein n=1 Tax=Bacillus pseudomycoides TaxID=64104 RepID=UPI001FB4AA64|nr:YqhR family membrane protein [Bacillus pseudomycoides]